MLKDDKKLKKKHTFNRIMLGYGTQINQGNIPFKKTNSEFMSQLFATSFAF